MSGYWTAWARALTGLTPTAKLVAAELALLADARGVAIVPLAHLSLTTGRTARAVRDALHSLEQKGLVRRDAEANPRLPFRGTRLQLVAHRPHPRAAGSRRRSTGPDSPGSRPAPGCQPPGPQLPGPQSPSLRELDQRDVGQRGVDQRDVAQPAGASSPGSHPTLIDPAAAERDLRSVLRECRDSGWEPPPTWRLATLLDQAGREYFGKLIGNRRRLRVTDDPWDTLSIAWEVARQHDQALISAREPWALWIHLTGQACSREDRESLSLLPLSEDWAEGGTAPIPATGAERPELHFGLDDFDAPLQQVVASLMKAGVPEAVAWAGTARLLELVEAGPSRRHWLAGRDAQLQALGIGERAARAWMTLLVGSRRGSSGALTTGMGTSARELARLIGEEFGARIP